VRLRSDPRMRSIIDISLPLDSSLPVWPNSTGIAVERVLDINNGDCVNNSHLSCDVHAGTHVDAPLHHLINGASVEQTPLTDLIGEVHVVEFLHTGIITKELLASLSLPANAQRLLIKTQNSHLWEKKSNIFNPSYVALTPDAAEWVVDNGIRLVGIDYLSVEPFDTGSQTHKILLKANVVILEGLNLSHVRPGTYELICLPIKLVGADGAPARVILRTLE
jgi:arylformamidase